MKIYNSAGNDDYLLAFSISLLKLINIEYSRAFSV